MLNDILTFDDLSGRYTDYMERVKALRFITGFEEIDKHIRGVAPGEVLTIIAYSGTFKTALLQNLLIDAAYRSGAYQLLISQEMPAEKVFERSMQMSNRLMGTTIERHYNEKSEHIPKMVEFAKKKGCGKLLTVEKSRRSLENIKAYVVAAEKKYGEVQTVGVDYLGLMSAPGKDIFHKMAELSYGLKELAKDIMKPVVVLAQVNRSYAASVGREIEMDAAKGGGDIEAGADFMFGMYLDDDGKLILKILKNRNGVAGPQVEMIVDKTSLYFEAALPYEPKKKDKKAPF